MFFWGVVVNNREIQMTGNTTVSKSPPLVTIALPVLNGGVFLESAVRSIIEQTWSNWELLIIDDGSTDRSIDELPYLADPRVFVLRDGKNKGLAARLNEAIAVSRGDYFARMDHDDVCHSDRILRQVTFLEKNEDIDLLATKCSAIGEDGSNRGEWPFAGDHFEICKRPWLGFYMPHPSWMGRIGWFRQNQYKTPAPYCCEDQELLLRAYRSSKYHALNDVLLAYRLRKHTPWRKTCRTIFTLSCIQINFFLRKGELTNVLMSLCAAVVRMACASFVFLLKSK